MIWYESNNPNSYATGKVFSVNEPCVTVMAGGMGGDSYSHWHFCSDGRPMKTGRHESKPPYRVPSMEEIRAVTWNGLTVASTFSGCGGSCTGYRMAGFRVVWANEFVPAAQASYKANADPSCVLDCRDIKLVKPEDVLQATGLTKGQLDLFDGSPPCQAFSMAGKREKGWGKKKKYEHGASQCNETLFGEYIRLLRGLMPKVFVAENVSGLVKGVAKGMFLEILTELKASGYKVRCKVLDAQWLGVPQMRQRTIFIGVRDDLGREPVFPKPLPYRYSVRDALPWIMKSTQDSKGQFDIRVNDGSRPHDTITASNAHHFQVEAVPLPPSRRAGSYGVQEVDPNKPCPTVTCASPGNDLAVPNMPDISRYAIGKEWDKIKPGQQSKRFFSLVKPALDLPAPCIQASHGEPSIAGVVHPIERRKFTIAELKRICAFPDDFILKGSFAQQWQRLGNSVPPVMMKAIAETIRKEILV